MRIDRTIAPAARAEALGGEVARVPRCLDCPGCRGLCAALIEMTTLPDAVIRPERRD